MRRASVARAHPAVLALALTPALAWLAGCPPQATVPIAVDPIGPVHREATGTLVVYTPADAFLDSDVSYYPHRSYEIRDERDEVLRIVPNHRSSYDENPTPIELAPGTYFVVGEMDGGDLYRIPIVIEAGRVTRVFVEELLRRAGKEAP